MVLRFATVIVEGDIDGVVVVDVSVDTVISDIGDGGRTGSRQSCDLLLQLSDLLL